MLLAVSSVGELIVMDSSLVWFVLCSVGILLCAMHVEKLDFALLIPGTIHPS